MPFAELPGRGKNSFKHHRMEASLEIPIGVPSWLLNDFSGMLQCPGGETVNLTMYRFHFGDSLSLQDWESVPYTGEAAIDYARMAFVKDYGLQAIGVRTCPDLSSMSSVTSPLIQFFSIVDTSKLTLAEKPGIGLDNTTRNCSAIFLTRSKFPNLENGIKPETGWYPNYIYAMLPKTKPHLIKKCQDYKADSTPFRKHGRKAYIRGYMHGFCYKVNMFAEGGRPNNLEFDPFVEIMEDVPATPVKKEVKPEAASTGGKRKIIFDPFADLGVRVLDELGDQDDGTDEPSPSKKAKLGRGKGTPTKRG
ncbi:hypothetical protein V8E54_007358 [Elaphomyces granulatus]